MTTTHIHPSEPAVLKLLDQHSQTMPVAEAELHAHLFASLSCALESVVEDGGPLLQ